MRHRREQGLCVADLQLGRLDLSPLPLVLLPQLLHLPLPLQAGRLLHPLPLTEPRHRRVVLLCRAHLCAVRL